MKIEENCPKQILKAYFKQDQILKIQIQIRKKYAPTKSVVEGLKE